MLDIDFSEIDNGVKNLKSAVTIRDSMGGAMYWQICEDDCLRLADKLSAAGVDKQEIASIGGWGLKS